MTSGTQCLLRGNLNKGYPDYSESATILLVSILFVPIRINFLKASLIWGTYLADFTGLTLEIVSLR